MITQKSDLSLVQLIASFQQIIPINMMHRGDQNQLLERKMSRSIKRIITNTN
jgi:hypothetical protein